LTVGAHIPRVRLVVGETPLQELAQLSRRLGRRILVKRDDLTGLAFGGNKVRQAEFFVGQAVAEGADTLVAGGSFAQSNHARVLAAAARAAGLEPVILLRPGTGRAATDGRGNALVTRLVAADVRVLEALRDAPSADRREEVAYRRRVFEAVADELRAQGRRPFVIAGSSVPLGVLGYVEASGELQRQLERLEVEPAVVFVTSLGVTHAGLELGARLLGQAHDVVGFAYQPAGREAAEATVRELAEGAAALLGVPASPTSVRTRSSGSGTPSSAAAPSASSRTVASAASRPAGW